MYNLGFRVIWGLPKLGVPSWGPCYKRILLLGCLYYGPFVIGDPIPKAWNETIEQQVRGRDVVESCIEHALKDLILEHKYMSDAEQTL